MIIVCPNSTVCPSLTQTSLTTPSADEGTWFIVFIASTIITVWPFFILSPIFTNFFAPGSGAKYAVPIIGDFTLVPSWSFLSDKTLLLEETTALVTPFSDKALFALETLIFLSPSWYSISVILNSLKQLTNSLINFL